jgi:hypothetical protein
MSAVPAKLAPLAQACADIAQGEDILSITDTPSAAVPEAHPHEARLPTGDDYLTSRRLTHGGSTRLHPTKQYSLFDYTLTTHTLV